MLSVLQDPPLPLAPTGRLRVAWSTATPLPQPVDRVVVAALHGVLALLRAAGHDVVEADPAYAGVQESFLVRYGRGVADDLAALADPSATELRTRAVAAVGRRMPDRLLARARRLGAAAAERLAVLPAGADVLVTPTLAGAAVAGRLADRPAHAGAGGPAGAVHLAVERHRAAGAERARGLDPGRAAARRPARRSPRLGRAAAVAGRRAAGGPALAGPAAAAAAEDAGRCARSVRLRRPAPAASPSRRGRAAGPRRAVGGAQPQLGVRQRRRAGAGRARAARPGRGRPGRAAPGGSRRRARSPGRGERDVVVDQAVRPGGPGPAGVLAQRRPRPGSAAQSGATKLSRRTPRSPRTPRGPPGPRARRAARCGCGHPGVPVEGVGVRRDAGQADRGRRPGPAAAPRRRARAGRRRRPPSSRTGRCRARPRAAATSAAAEATSRPGRGVDPP